MGMAMISGARFCEERGLDIYQPQIPAEDFYRLNIPPVVACTGCGSTMNVLSSAVRVEPEEPHRVWCTTCSGENN